MKLFRSSRCLQASLAACALLALSAPASAMVTYSFSGSDSGSGRYALDFSTDSFITEPPSSRTISLLTISGVSCTVSGTDCARADLEFQKGATAAENVFSLFLQVPGQSAGFFFTPGVNPFGDEGTFRAACGCDDGSGTLTTALSPVPEPSSWALFAFGAGIVGWSMRRRRPTAA